MLNLEMPSEQVFNEYLDYIKVAREFLEHVVLTEGEK